MIEVQDFSKQYKNSFKISGISFSVAPGKITALIGTNGSGKSTIIKAICGFHYADGGIIKVSDGSTECNVLQNPSFALKSIGYLPEVSSLPEKLYTADFLTYAAKLHGIEPSKIDECVRNAVKKCGLSDVLTKRIRELSKGYKQRVNLSQAIIHNPSNLVLDEPVSGLDPLQISQLHKLLRDFSAKKSILISTHLLSEVQDLCDNVVIISRGRQLAFGNTVELKSVMEAEFSEL